MKWITSLHTGSRLMGSLVLVVAFALLAGCTALPMDPALLEQAGNSPAESTEQMPAVEVEPARATVATRSLRVREAPSTESEMIAGVKEGETYDVLAISSDGAWIQLAIPSAPDGKGWVSANFVTLEGDITNIPTVEVEASASTDTAGEANAEEATAEDEASEAAPAVTPEPGYVLIQTDGTPLRVRSAPTTEEDNKIGNVFNGEVYRILEISEDGQWIKIEVPELSEDGGWISAEFAVIGQ
ncbi:SH3 domain-containing protein [Litorilinea aerophila]|nr:SH3 domain-containing protein [Litorilinea aerophila]MCC9075431.1 SH3 domain-containing protein [Litorilinea aerophila]